MNGPHTDLPQRLINSPGDRRSRHERVTSCASAKSDALSVKPSSARGLAAGEGVHAPRFAYDAWFQQSARD